MKKDKTKKEFIEEIVFLKKRIGKLEKLGSQCKRVEEMLDVSYERLINVLDSLDSLVYVVDFNSYELLFINKYGRDIWGDIQGQKCWQAIQKDQKGPCPFCTNDKLVSDTGISTGVYQWEFQNTVNGRWYECRDQAIPWTGKALVRMEIATDITERKQAEEKLIHFQKALENSTDAVGMSTPKGRHYYQNEAFTKLFGLSVDEVSGVSGPPKTIYADEKIGQEVFDRIMSGNSWSGEVKMLTKDKVKKDIFLRAYSVKDKENKVIALVGIHTDITARKQAEDALVFSNVILRTQQESSIDGILVVGEKGEILSFNQRFIEMWGISIDVIESKSDDRALQSVMDKLVNPEEFMSKVKRLYEIWDEICIDEIVLKDGRIFDRYSAPMISAEKKYYGRLWNFRDITLRKKAEEMLLAAKDYTENIIKSMFDTLIVINPDGKIRSINEATAILLGYKEEELIGKPFGTIVAKEEEEEEEEGIPFIGTRLKELIKEGFIKEYDMTYKTKSGEMIPVSFSGAVMRDKDGELIGVVCIGRDLRERNRAEDELRKSEDLLSEMTTQVPGVVYQFYARPNGEMGFYYISDRSEQTIGLKSDLEGYLERFVALVILEHRESFIQSIQKSVKELSEWKYEGILQKPTGEKIWFFGNSTPLQRENEIVFNGMISDITARKQVEKIILESEEKIHLLLDSTAEAIYGLDMHGNCTFCNNACLSLLGYKHHDELLGKNMHWQIHGKHSDGTPFPVEECRIFKAFKQGEGTHVDDEVLWRSDGTSFPAEYWSYPQHSNGVVVGAVVTFLNITERKRSEDALRESEETLRVNIENSFDVIFTLNKEGEFLFVSSAWERHFGYPIGDVMGKSFAPFVYPDDIAPLSEYLERVLSSGKSQASPSYRVKHADGSWRWIVCNGTPYVDTKGERQFIGVGRDITESKKADEMLKEAQEQLFQTSKMASLGQLSAGAAHEINNPLAGVVGFTEAILLDLKNKKIAPDRIANDLKIVLKNANRCKVIIGNLLNFIRAKDLKRQESDINSFIDDALALVEYKTKSQNVEVVKKYEKSPRKVSIDPDQMMQVLINVISNAQNAMPEGGELFVRTWSENNFVLIEVKDTGIGIEKEALLRVFDPFFTTREPGQGVGLGLSISYSIMKRHEGSIEVKSDGKNKGASFIIKIPA